MRTATLLLLFIFLVAGAVTAQEEPEPATTSTTPSAVSYTSIEEARAATAVPWYNFWDDPKPIVVKFYTDWCSWCKTIDTVVLVDSAVIDFFNNEMALVIINAEVDSALTKQYHVSGYPTLVMIAADGNEIDRLVGYLPPEPFLKTFRDYGNGIGTLDDLLNRATTETDRELYSEIAEKYKYRGGSDDAKTWYQKIVDEGDPLDSLSGESRLALADMFRRTKDWEAALDAYKAVREDFGDNPTGTNAEIWTAIVYRQSGDTTKAVTGFEAFIESHPDHEHVEYCQKQIKKLTEPPEEKKDTEG